MTAPADPKALADGHSRYIGHRPVTCCDSGYYDGGGGWWCCNSPQNSEVEQLRRRLAEVERERDEALNELDGIAKALGMQDTDESLADEAVKLIREREAAERDLARARADVAKLQKDNAIFDERTDVYEAFVLQHGIWGKFCEWWREREKSRAALSPATKEPSDTERDHDL